MKSLLAHTNDPDTSHAAVAAINPTKKARIQAAILELLAVEPLTAFELTDAYFDLVQSDANRWPDVKRDSVAKRLSELVNSKVVVDTRARRQSPYDRPAVVWTLA